MASYRLTLQEKFAMGRRLQAGRWTTGLTLRQVGDAVGVSANTVTQWERGALPKAEYRAALAGLYGVAEADLFAEFEAGMDVARALLRPA